MHGLRLCEKSEMTERSGSSSVLHIGLLGCSKGPGLKHIEAWEKVEGVKISVLAESDSLRASELAERFQIPHVYHDFRQAIAAKKADIIDIALPIRFHAEAALMAVDAGYHVLCEKPITETLDQAEQIVEKVRNSNKVFGVNFQYRFMTFLTKMAEIITSGKIGRPVCWCSNMAEGSKDREANTGYPGILEDCGIHRFDFGTVVFGKPVCVQACGMKLSHRPDLGDYDTGTAVVTYEHGDQIAVHMCNGMPRGLKGINSDEVFGPEGIIQYEPTAGNIWMDHSQFTWTGRDKVVHAVKVEDWQGDWGLYRTMLCRHFVDCVRDPDKPRGPMCGAEEGHLALRVTKAVRASLETGRAVQL